MALDLTQFSLNRVAFEVRYDFAPLLWDRSGAIHTEIRKRYPNLTYRQVEPSNQSMRLTKDIELAVQADKSFIICRKPSSDLAELKVPAAKLFPIIIDRLEVADFTRIGLRMFFQKPFPTKLECSAFMVNSLPSFRRGGKHFGIESEVTDPAITLRWEGKTTGCLVNFKMLEAKLNIDVPFEFAVDVPSVVDLTAVSLDVDYYAHGVTATTKFSPSAIIENWVHVIRRDIGAFVHG